MVQTSWVALYLILIRDTKYNNYTFLHSFVCDIVSHIIVQHKITIIWARMIQTECGWNKDTHCAALTHWGLVTPIGDIDLGQHWLRQWLVALRHLAITWTNVDLSSVRSSGIHLRAISLEIPQPPFAKVSLQITYLKLIEISQGPMS